VTEKIYTVHTRRRGIYAVTAKTRAHAVAAVVARLKLTEAQTEEVTRWIVFADGPDDPAIDQMRYHMEGML